MADSFDRDTRWITLDDFLAVEQVVIQGIESGIPLIAGAIRARIVTGLLHGKITKRLFFIDNVTGVHLSRADQLFDGGLLQ